MPATIVVGTQWGDEGKGRVVDWLSRDAHLVARFGGGDNAGHTVVAQGHKLGLHLVPSGVLHPDLTCLIGAGVVINPETLVNEMDELLALGVDIGAARLKISAAAHIILPTHRALDGAREQVRAEGAIGTTKRGIGPTYADKAARINLRAGEMSNPERFADRVAEVIQAHNQQLQVLYGLDPLPVDEIAANYCDYAKRLNVHLIDGSVVVGEMLSAGKRVICEGAQGLLLDLDHGTYPYVTSSSTIAGGALTGLGFGPQHVTRIIGIAKAYTTRVGAGPFLTELLGDVGEQIRQVGYEFGTTTGRPRRCGWLDLVILRYAARVNGLSELALTKLDVLSGVDQLKVAVAYEREGERVTHFPAEYGAEALTEWTPVYEELSGWQEDITSVRTFADLPKAAQVYVKLVEELLHVPISFIGVGPERTQTIMRSTD